MAIIAHRFGYKFEKYEINLQGCLTTIKLKYEQNSKSEYELFYGPGISEDRFNKALSYLLDCLNSL